MAEEGAQDEEQVGEDVPEHEAEERRREHVQAAPGGEGARRHAGEERDEHEPGTGAGTGQPGAAAVHPGEARIGLHAGPGIRGEARGGVAGGAGTGDGHGTQPGLLGGVHEQQRGGVVGVQAEHGGVSRRGTRACGAPGRRRSPRRSRRSRP